MAVIVSATIIEMVMYFLHTGAAQIPCRIHVVRLLSQSVLGLGLGPKRLA
jgi:hypothetical protein